MAVESLLQPIAEQSSAGVDMSFSSEFDAVQELRREDDPTLPQGEFVTELKVADWQSAAAFCEQLLKTRTKDLRLAGWLLEAWAHLRGFEGLADGLFLVDGLCSRFWAQIHPLPEDGEQELRIGNLAWVLGRVEALSRRVPLLKSQERTASLGEIELARARQQTAARASGGEAQAEEDALTVDAVARLQRDTSPEFLVANLAAAKRCVEALVALEATLEPLLGSEGPGFSSARKALDAAMDAAGRFAREAGVQGSGRPTVVAPMEATSAGSKVGKEGSAEAGAVVPMTRAQALQQLRLVAEFFRQTEPHSPVAYLADKAAQWGGMPLHVWLRSVMKDGSTLAQLEELLGVSPAEPGN